MAEDLLSYSTGTLGIPGRSNSEFIRAEKKRDTRVVAGKTDNGNRDAEQWGNLWSNTMAAAKGSLSIVKGINDQKILKKAKEDKYDKEVESSAKVAMAKDLVSFNATEASIKAQYQAFLDDPSTLDAEAQKELLASVSDEQTTTRIAAQNAKMKKYVEDNMDVWGKGTADKLNNYWAAIAHPSQKTVLNSILAKTQKANITEIQENAYAAVSISTTKDDDKALEEVISDHAETFAAQFDRNGVQVRGSTVVATAMLTAMDEHWDDLGTLQNNKMRVDTLMLKDKYGDDADWQKVQIKIDKLIHDKKSRDLTKANKINSAKAKAAKDLYKNAFHQKFPVVGYKNTDGKAANYNNTAVHNYNDIMMPDSMLELVTKKFTTETGVVMKNLVRDEVVKWKKYQYKEFKTDQVFAGGMDNVDPTLIQDEDVKALATKRITSQVAQEIQNKDWGGLTTRMNSQATIVKKQVGQVIGQMLSQVDVSTPEGFGATKQAFLDARLAMGEQLFEFSMTPKDRLQFDIITSGVDYNMAAKALEYISSGKSLPNREQSADVKTFIKELPVVFREMAKKTYDTLGIMNVSEEVSLERLKASMKPYSQDLGDITVTFASPRAMENIGNTNVLQQYLKDTTRGNENAIGEGFVAKYLSDDEITIDIKANGTTLVLYGKDKTKPSFVLPQYKEHLKEYRRAKLVEQQRVTDAKNEEIFQGVKTQYQAYRKEGKSHQQAMHQLSIDGFSIFRGTFEVKALQAQSERLYATWGVGPKSDGAKREPISAYERTIAKEDAEKAKK